MRRLSAIIVAGVMILTPRLADSSGSEESQKQGAVTRAEATRLAQQFFDTEIVIEGALDEPSIQGSSWAFPVRLGYAGTLQPAPLLVDRNTGEVSWTALGAHKAKYGLKRNGKSR